LIHILDSGLIVSHQRGKVNRVLVDILIL